MLKQEPRILDAWSWNQSQSMKFNFRLHSPGCTVTMPLHHEQFFQNTYFAKVNLMQRWVGPTVTD